MQAATSGAFLPFAAEILFLMILKGYYNEMTTDAEIAARVEMRIAERVLAGVPPAQIDIERRVMKAKLGDRKAVFDLAYRKFFFIDEHPENVERFKMSFELLS